MAVIREDQIVTRLTVEGLEDLNKAKANLNDINKTKVNIDTKGITDFGKAVKNIADKEIVNLNNRIQSIPNQLKNIDPAILSKFEKSLSGVTDEFEILAKTVQFVKSNMDKLNLKPKEFQDLTKYVEAAEFTLAKQGKTINEVGQKNVSLRGKLAAVRNELTLLDQAGKSGTSAFKNLQVQAGHLQDQIDDNRAAVRALSSDTLKLDAGIGAIRGIVAAFTAYQGVLGVLGVENKDFEKTLIKINGAMALLQGLQEITNLLQAQSATRLVLTSIAQSVWNAALSITGKKLAENTIATEINTAANLENAAATGTAATATGGAAVATGALSKAGSVVAGIFSIAGAIVTAFVAIIGGLIYNAVRLIGEIDELKHATERWLLANDKLGESIVKRLKIEQAQQRSLRGGLEDQRTEIELLKAKGASIEAISAKQNALFDKEIAQNKERLAILAKTNSPATNKESIDISLANRKLEADKQQFNIETTNKILAQDARIHQLRIDNIKDEYQKSIQSIKAQRDESIRLNNLNTDQTKDQRAAFRVVAEQKAANDIEKINIESNKKIFEAYLETTQNKYDKEVELINHKASEDIRLSNVATKDKELYAEAIRAAADEKIKELDKKAQLEIQTLRINNIQDEYDRKIRQIIEVNIAQKKAFIGSKKDTDAYILESDRQLIEARRLLEQERNFAISDLKIKATTKDYEQAVKIALESYNKDLAYYKLGEDQKGEYARYRKILLNKELEELERASIEKLANIQIQNINSVYAREKALAEKRASDDIKDFLKNIDTKTAEGQAKLDKFRDEVIKRLNKEVSNAAKDFTSLGEIIFGDGDDAATKRRIKAFNNIVSESLNIFKTISDAAVAADDAQIASAERRITRFKELADKGGAEQLQKQQDYLDALQAKREKDLEQQRAIAAAQLLINSALNVSNAITAVTKAFAEGTFLDGILTAISLAATVASTIISVNSALTSVPGFAEGVDRLQGAGTSKSDSIPARLSKNEKVMTAKHNEEMGWPTNLEVVKYFKIGKQAADGSVIPGSAVSNSVNYYYQGDQKEDYSTKILKELHRDVIDTKTALNKFKVEIKIRDKQFHAMVQSVQSGIDHQKSKR